MMRWQAVAILAVTVPATAYVVSETVVDEPVAASRSTLTLAEDRRGARSPDVARRQDGIAGDAAGGSRPATSCDDAADDAVSVVRPRPTELGDDDEDDRGDDD